MKFMVYLVLVGQVVLSGVVALQFKGLEDARRDGRAQTCRAISAQANTLIGLIRKGEQNLPTLTYYKQHPSELAAIVRQNEAAIKALTPPAYC